MLKYLIYEKQDGDLIIQGFTATYSEKSFEELIKNYRAENTEGLNYYFLEGCGANYSNHDSKCCDFKATDHIDKWHIENGKLVTDHNWEKVLIPHSELSRKHRARCLRKIEAEHQKENPDPIKLSKLQFEYEKCREWGKKESPELYEIALRNIDEDGHDKPLIKEKLKEKIKYLKSNKDNKDGGENGSF